MTDLANDTVGSADTISAGAGDDIVIAGAGSDMIDGGAGADSIDAGTGNDQVVMYITDTIDGGTGVDSLVVKTSSLDLRGVTPHVSNVEALNLAQDTGANQVVLTK